MRKLFISLIISATACLSFNSNHNSLQQNGCDNIPELNQKIVSFVKSKMTQKVGRGECWDLAAEALNNAGANWDKKYGFGKLIDPKKDCVYPGDIIQFKNVVVQTKQGNAYVFETMEKHTAIVYEVKKRQSYIIADQNNGRTGKKVSVSPFEIQNITRGSIKVYRPVK
jgi:hypothetical protein